MSIGIQAPPLGSRASAAGGARDIAETRTPDKTSDDAHKVGQDFEAILVRQMLSKANLGGPGAYGDMATEAMAAAVTKGGGLGLGRVIEQQLAPHHATSTAVPASPAEAAKAFKKSTSGGASKI